MTRPTPLMDFSTNVQECANPFEPLADVIAYVAMRAPGILDGAVAMLMDVVAHRPDDHVQAADYATVAISIETLIQGVKS